MPISSDLPITINADQALIQSLGLSGGLLEKLEAWANFSTLKANWYGDDSKTISIKVTLVSQAFFEQHFQLKTNDKWQLNTQSNTALSSSASQKKHSVFMALLDISATANSAKWVESNIQGQLQHQLQLFLNELAQSLGLDPVID
ncbi:hypothetical protein [Thalassotalea atypica]|uniref:hypothetical protein n=1 Tax=Thalassotalea atypica TaxID=2054316 RepID=UPI00257434EE|nr:hypothetical protein [Thalassotalea atypica]